MEAGTERRDRSVPARGRWPTSAAVLAGGLPAVVFPAPALWWLAPVALVPWLLLLRSADSGRRAALRGWLGGTGFMLAVHHWLLPSLHVFLLLLAGLLGLLWAPWGLLVRRLLGADRPRGGAAVLATLLVPSGWLAVELVRSWEYLGGPWGLLGSSQWQFPPALRLASLGGVWLVSFVVVAVNTALTVLVAVPSARASAAVTLLAWAGVVGSAGVWTPLPQSAGNLRVAVVQPGVVAGPSGAERRFALQERLTRRLAGRGVELVVWGESSVGYDLEDRPDLRDRLRRLSRRVGADLLVNVDARRPGRQGIFKSSVLIGPAGPDGQRYDKMRLVPFGEYVPARSLLGWVTSLGKAAGEDRMRGAAPVVMEPTDGGGPRIGPLVCFESAFPDMGRRLVRRGSAVLVVQSSTSSFQHSWAPWQHASLAALRAAESWRPVVHATLTGVSAVYGPGGEQVGERLSTTGSGAAVYEVPLGVGSSPYVRFGDWIVWTALGAVGAFGAWEAFRLLARRRPMPRLEPGQPAETPATRPPG
ncbi:apolipoprotein N-acyltransferase [Streptomyces sp. TP-A0874]|uniref:apolipoprotein N-acyltransferase n=1 Tax=Streptomyces sp. TP-A0874 TaxID=549819 RepID=UPI000852AC4C|nr:apolipoprotein N-acyltransferase [Streptomyces sp. TP-A0874]